MSKKTALRIAGYTKNIPTGQGVSPFALVIDTLTMAAWRRSPSEGLLHHSEGRRQYASHTYQAELEKYGMVCSMSGKGDCWDNAVVERCFRSLTTQRITPAYTPHGKQRNRM